MSEETQDTSLNEELPEDVTEETAESEASEESAAAESSSTDENGGKKNKKFKPRFPFWKRLLIFLLGMLIGTLSCLGGLAGAGFWAYKNLSIQKLNDFGIGITLPESLQGTGDVDITTYTLAQFIADFSSFSDSGTPLSIHSLSEKYGLKILADVDKMLPEALAKLPFSTLGKGNALEEIFSCLDFSLILGFLPEGTFSEPMLEAMEGKDLSALAGGDTSEFLKGVKLGYLLGIKYEKVGEQWVIVLEEGKQKGLLEYMAELDLGAFLGGENEGGALGMLKEQMGDAPISAVLGFTTESGDMLDGVLFGDIIVKNEETGEYSLRLSEAFNDVRFGALAGYTDKNGVWYDKEDKEASLLMAKLFNQTVGDFANGEFSLDNITEGMLIGDIMNYTKQSDGSFHDKNGKEVTGLAAILAETSLDSLLNGSLSFDGIIGDEKVGTLLNYTVDKNGKWFDSDGKEVTGLSAILADTDAGKLVDGSLSFDSLVGDEKVGTILNYTVDKNGNWFDQNGKEVSGISAILADTDASKLLDGTLSFDTLVGDEKIGVILNYTLDKNGKWFDQDGKEVSGLASILADTDASKLLEGSLSFEDLVGDEKVGVVLNYTLGKDGKWIDQNGKEVTGLSGILADADAGKLLDGSLTFDSLFDDEKVGIVLNYTQDSRGNWYDSEGKLVTGLDASVANITMKQFFGKESIKAADVFADVYMGEVMEFTVASYKSDGKTPDTWKDKNGKIVEGFDADVANLKVGDLSDGDGVDFKEVFGDDRVGDLQGYTYHSAEEKWYDENGNALETLDNAIANMTVADIIDGNIDFKDAFKDEKVGHLQNYTYANGKWYKDAQKKQPLSSFDSVIANWSLGDIMDGTIDYKESFKNEKVGDLQEYTYADGKWYKDAQKTKPLSSFDSVIANWSLGDIMDGTIDYKESFKNEKVGDLQEYTYADGKWYKDAQKTKPLSSFDSVIANWTLGDIMDGTIDYKDSFRNEKVGDLQEYTYADGKWYKDAKKTQPLSSFDSVIANWSLGDIMDGKVDFKDSFRNEKVGDLQEYTYADGKWYKDAKKTKPLSALDSVIASWSLGDIMDKKIDYKASLNDIYIGEFMGYTGTPGNWMDGSRRITGLSATIADMRFDDLDDNTSMTHFLGSTTVGDVMGYHRDGNVWKDENGTAVSTVLSLLADKKVNEMDSAIHSWQLGDLMGYQKKNGAWVNPDGDINSMMSHVADLKLDQLSDPDAVHEAVDGMKMCDIFGYTERADGWYSNSGTKISGVMAYLASHTVKELPGEVENMKLADIFDYTEKNGKWYDKNNQELVPILAALADCPINQMHDRVSSLSLNEIFQDTSDGFFMILGGTTKLVDLEARIDAVFGTGEGAATIGDFMDAGIIDPVSDEQSQKLSTRLGVSDWRDMSVVSFINAVISAITIF